MEKSSVGSVIADASAADRVDAQLLLPLDNARLISALVNDDNKNSNKNHRTNLHNERLRSSQRRSHGQPEHNVQNDVNMDYNSVLNEANDINIVDDERTQVAPGESNGIDDKAEMEDRTYPPPVFDYGMPRNITARSGQTAAINCRVENLGDKSVSWIRKRDLHILTAGILTYTSDERFKVIRTADSKDWTLHVKYAQPRDSGIYECQVNTEPKISMAFRLNVIVSSPDAKAIITGPTDLYVKVGSAITLTCHVKQPSSTAQDIGPIYWYRGHYVLTPFVAHLNEAAIDLQRISMESKLGEKLQSRLRISNAQTSDSGNYTCSPTTADAASVLVNVINDESPAAMQKSVAARLLHCNGSNGDCNYKLLLTAVIIVIITTTTTITRIKSTITTIIKTITITVMTMMATRTRFLTIPRRNAPRTVANPMQQLSLQSLQENESPEKGRIKIFNFLCHISNWQQQQQEQPSNKKDINTFAKSS